MATKLKPGDTVMFTKKVRNLGVGVGGINTIRAVESSTNTIWLEGNPYPVKASNVRLFLRPQPSEG